jgi:PPE-SVP subfamily C-terminal region
MLGSTLGNGFGSGMGSAQVTAGMGRTASLGTLSVPQSWAAAAPEFSHVGSTLSGASANATPAAAVGPDSMLNGMPPMRPTATRAMDAPTTFTPRFGFRPTVVQTPIYAG